MTAVQNWLPVDLVAPAIVRNVIRDVLRDLQRMTQRDAPPASGLQLMVPGVERC